MSTHISDKPGTSKRVRYDGGVREKRQGVKGEEEVSVVRSKQRADRVRDQGSGLQEVTGDQGQRAIVIERGIFRAAAVCLTLLFLLQAVRTIDMAMYYNSSDKQWQITHDNLQTRYNNLTLERDHLKSEVNQLREAADKVCSYGWQKFGSRCYQRSSEEKTWEEGRQHCLKSGADLVIINRTKEQEFIKSLSSGRGASWIGLNKAEGNWTWVDGTPLTTTGYWASGSPDNNADRNCVVYNHVQGDWIDAKCEYGFRWICEK